MSLTLTELFLIGIGLAADAFAVSLCKGLNLRKLSVKSSVIIGLFFGGFQAIMPLLGWLIGKQFETYIVSFDHWIVFILLSFIGGKMIYEALSEKEEACNPNEVREILDLKELFVLAVATSIDALAVGITFAFLSVNIVEAVSIIGVITFILALIGVYLGSKLGAKYKNKAEICGGIILILIGLKILLEHLQIINI